MSQNFPSPAFPDFFQSPPVLPPFWSSEPFLPRFFAMLARKHGISQENKNSLEEDYKRFGEFCSRELHHWGNKLEKSSAHPELSQYSAWGNRIDNIETHPLWSNMHRVAASEGLIAMGYERKFGCFSRTAQFVKLFLFASNSGLYSCPLAMTDGAARLLEVLGHKGETFDRLTTRNPDVFITSGQWMTEKAGGSDVSGGTRTLAVPEKNFPGGAGEGKFRLFGYKWFTSAIDAQVAITLGRETSAENFRQQFVSPLEEIPQEEKAAIEDRLMKQPLSCFLVKVHDSSSGNGLNSLNVVRLKDKLGTRSLPTAELRLSGTRAIRLGQAGKGISTISSLINITRIHNAIASCSNMRKILLLQGDYLKRRSAFGRRLWENSLHLQILLDMEVSTRAACAFTFDVISRLGKAEMPESSKLSKEEAEENSLLLRLLIPCIKLYTAKLCVAVVSEGVEAFGGAGYLEDTGIPKILRDSQVFPIWEGTTNVLSLDVVRVFKTTKGKCGPALQKAIRKKFQEAKLFLQGNNKTLDEQQKKAVLSCIVQAEALFASLELLFPRLSGFDSSASQTDRFLRDIAYSISFLYCLALLLEFAVFSGCRQDFLVAVVWFESKGKISAVTAGPLEGRIEISIKEMQEILFGPSARL